jgi:hypothetical protein
MASRRCPIFPENHGMGNGEKKRDIFMVKLVGNQKSLGI